MGKKQIQAASPSIAEQAEAQAKLAALTSSLKSVGTDLGKYISRVSRERGKLIETVKAGIDIAMQEGLAVDMLKAPTKTKAMPCYTALVSSLEKAAGANYDPRIRDNYISKIRAYVKDRGANELDLFGNIAAAKARDAAKLQATPVSGTEPNGGDNGDEDSDDEAVPVKKGVTNQLLPKLEGLKPLHEFMVAWLAANPAGKVAGKYRDMVVDIDKEIADVLSK